MFKPCPNCGFLVALIAGREASQRCPRCGSALVSDAELAELAEAEPPRRRRSDAAEQDARDVASTRLPTRNGEDRASTDRFAASDATTVDVAAAAPAVEHRASPHGEPVSNETSDAAIAADAGIDAHAADVEPARSTDEDTSEADAPPAHDGPSFVRRRTRPRAPRGRRWPWLVALPLLGLLLALQLLLAQRVELARDATWRPLVLQVCGVLGCDVPAWHEPRAFAMVARGVRPSPSHPGVLRVSATVRNDARWPQPAPIVLISLSDVDGRVLGARAVTPREYGHRAGLVAPGETLDVAFDVREPAGRVESFDFQLQ